jgi:pyridoxine/pyridoxamine 5'-phosphate oxidase
MPSTEAQERVVAETFTKADLLRYLRESRLATVATLGADGAPQAAYVGIGVTDDLRIVFDTITSSRKHANLLRDARIAVTVGGPGEKTLQYEGRAGLIATRGPDGADVREAYYASWPDGRERAAAWADLVYWCVTPAWARFTDYERGPLIQPFFFGVYGQR